MAKEKINKSILSKELGISTGHFSKLYNADRPVPSQILKRLKQISTGQLKTSNITAQEGQHMMGQILQAIGRLEGTMTEKFNQLEKRLSEVEEKKTRV